VITDRTREDASADGTLPPVSSPGHAIRQVNAGAGLVFLIDCVRFQEPHD